jgi:hypothetical protein
MPARFESGIYSPEAAKLMRDALDEAWEQIRIAPKEVELARLMLASTIIDLVEAGVDDCNRLAAQAIKSLNAAMSANRSVVRRH